MMPSTVMTAILFGDLLFSKMTFLQLRADLARRAERLGVQTAA